MADKKKRGQSVSDKMAARARSNVMGPGGTGDAAMDSVLAGESYRRSAFANASRATTPYKTPSNMMSDAIKSIQNMLKGRKKRA